MSASEMKKIYSQEEAEPDEVPTVSFDLLLPHAEGPGQVDPHHGCSRPQDVLHTSIYVPRQVHEGGGVQRADL